MKKKKQNPADGGTSGGATGSFAVDNGEHRTGPNTPEQGSTSTGAVAALPLALAPMMAERRWVIWRWEVHKGKRTKVPYQPRNPTDKAATDNPATWATYEQAVRAASRADGIGFCLQGSQFASFDIDNCRDSATGEIHAWAQELVTQTASYCEVTVSGTGLRIIGLGDGEHVHRKLKVPNTGITCEPYRRATRYIVMTGNQIGTAGLTNIDAEIDRVVGELGSRRQPRNRNGRAQTGSAEPEARALSRELTLMLSVHGDRPAGYPSRSELLYAFIHECLRRNVDENRIIELCLDDAYRGNSIFDHVSENDGADYVRRQIERAANAADATTDERGRATITIVEGELDRVWREIQDALLRSKAPVYVRKNTLVQPIWRMERSIEDGRDYLTAHLMPYNAMRLTDVVGHHAARFVKRDTRTNVGYRPVDPPKNAIDTLLEIKHWLFPTIIGIINSPTMRPDGSLLTEQGYDAQSQLFYKASGDLTLPEIPERPSREEALAALDLLRSLLENFPFEDAVSRSVALAGILTTVLRGAFPVAPIFAITAPEARTGKTYLAQLIASLATGHLPMPLAGSNKPEEMEKRIETAALSGRPIMFLNNLPNGMTLQSEALAQLASEGQFSFRKLGTNEEGPCDCRGTTVIATGNNIQLVSDLVPRTAVCRLNANTEEPERRTFSFNPLHRIRDERGKYIAACFTIVRAYRHAGEPRSTDIHTVAGFDQWSSFVQQPLVWLGEADPFGGIKSARAADPVLEELAALLDALFKYKADLPNLFTAADCKRLAEEKEIYAPYGSRRPDLYEIMAAGRGQISTKSFGHLLKRHLDRRHKGRYIRVVTNTNSGLQYKLEGPGAETDAAPREGAVDGF